MLALVVPGEREQRLVARQRRAGVELLQLLAELVEEPGVGATVVGWVDRDVVPLQQALRVGERALLLRRRRGGDEEHLGLDLRRRRRVRIVLPEHRALGLEPIDAHQPVELAHAGAVQDGVGRASGGVLAEQEVALDLAVGHPVEIGQLRVVVVDPRQERVGEVVVLGRRVAVPGLEQAHRELLEVRPVAVGHPLVLAVVVEGLVLVVVGRLRQVAGQDVVEGRDVGRALDGRVAAHRHDAAARAAHVAEQQLEDPGGADDLHAGRVLRPAEGVDDRCGPLAPRIRAQELGDANQLLGPAAGHLRHHLRRVAGEVAPQDLHHAARIFERRVFRTRWRPIPSPDRRPRARGRTPTRRCRAPLALPDVLA